MIAIWSHRPSPHLIPTNPLETPTLMSNSPSARKTTSMMTPMSSSTADSPSSSNTARRYSLEENTSALAKNLTSQKMLPLSRTNLSSMASISRNSKLSRGSMIPAKPSESTNPTSNWYIPTIRLPGKPSKRMPKIPLPSLKRLSQTTPLSPDVGK